MTAVDAHAVATWHIMTSRTASQTGGAGTADAYLRRMRWYATLPELDIWYDSTRADKLIKYFEPADRHQVSIHIEKKRRRRTSRGAFAKLTAMAHGRHRHLRRLGLLHGRDYYIRQFRDMKIIPTTELIAPRLAEFATACGGALARAHARTGDPLAIDSYIGKGPKFTAEIGRFADRYADQNEKDHAQLVKAIAAGTVQSRPTR
jgi:hypothetical protein